MSKAKFLSCVKSDGQFGFCSVIFGWDCELAASLVSILLPSILPLLLSTQLSLSLPSTAATFSIRHYISDPPFGNENTADDSTRHHPFQRTPSIKPSKRLQRSTSRNRLINLQASIMGKEPPILPSLFHRSRDGRVLGRGS